jgi:hypothetical protein
MIPANPARQIQAVNKPFPHFFTPALLEEDALEALRTWIRAGHRWQRSEASFYHQNNLALWANHRKLASGLDLGFDLHAHIVEMGERLFGVAMRRDRFEAYAHKFEQGQGIGVHNDVPAGGTESHRIVLHLSESYHDAMGGHLLLHGANDANAFDAVYRPILNSAVAFRLDARSWHSVVDVVSGTRFSVVFSLWEDDRPAGPSARDLWPDLVAALADAGAAGVPHSERSLLDHLVGVADLLLHWTGDQVLARAGLFHSVRGTRSFRADGLHGLDTVALDRLIGRDATSLAEQFAHGPIDLANGADARARSRLLHLYWANLIEQASFVPISDQVLADSTRCFEAHEAYLASSVRPRIARFLAIEPGGHA